MLCCEVLDVPVSRDEVLVKDAAILLPLLEAFVKLLYLLILLYHHLFEIFSQLSEKFHLDLGLQLVVVQALNLLLLAVTPLSQGCCLGQSIGDTC